MAKGDFAVTRSRGHPDVPTAPRAVAAVVADTLRPSANDLLDWRDPRPAAQKVADFFRRRRHAPENGRPDD
jgi:hypothetical protein